MKLTLLALLAALYSYTYTGTTVTSSATLVDSTIAHNFEKLWNNCGSTVYVGFSPTITATSGIPVALGSWIEFDEESCAGNRLYAITSSGTCDVRVLEKKRP